MLKRKFLSWFIITVIIISTVDACVSHEFPRYVCPDQAISFTSNIQPIIDTKCAIPGCHNGDNGADKNWTKFSLFEERALNGEVKRRVLERIMPPADSPAGPLSADEIAKIACWADQGSQNN